MQAPESQVVFRNEDCFSDGHWLIVNAPEQALFTQWPSQYSQLQQTLIGNDHKGFATHLDAFDSTVSNPVSGALVFLPKVKTQLSMILHNLASILHTDAEVYIVGHNKSGIKSASKLLDNYAHSIVKVDSAKHCGLIRGLINPPQQAFDIARYFSEKTYTLNDLTWQVAGLPGVFSQDGLDEGTKLLLQHLPSGLSQGKANVLDFACGAGVIGCYLLRLNPAIELTASDISALAIASTQRSLSLNDQKATVIASEGIPEVSKIERNFDYIISNPPFHNGVKTDYRITQTFINTAYHRLNKKGQLRIVANRFLPYPDIMQDAFGNVETIAQSNTFSIYASIK